MKKLLLLCSLVLCGCQTKVYENVDYWFDKDIGQYRVDINYDGEWDYKTSKVVFVRKESSSLRSAYYPETSTLVIYANI